jgi:hypothetical protein
LYLKNQKMKKKKGHQQGTIGQSSLPHAIQSVYTPCDAKSGVRGQEEKNKHPWQSDSTEEDEVIAAPNIHTNTPSQRQLYMRQKQVPLPRNIDDPIVVRVAASHLEFPTGAAGARGS